MEFRILGPVELWSAGQRCDLGSLKERLILAALLLTPGTQVSAEVLIDRVWDDGAPAKARDNLFAYISRIRRRLRHAVGELAKLHGRSGGYVLDIDPERVDLHVFRLQWGQARAIARSGDGEQAVLLLRQAEKLWRGTPFAGLPGDWAARVREGLDEEHRAAIAERTGLELSLGKHSEILGELQSLLARYPLDETLVAQRMTALYRVGRQSDALDLYRRTHRRLVDEQGTQPGPGLAQLHQRILRRDPRLGVTPIYRRPDGVPQPNTLPPYPDHFVGRADEAAALARGIQRGDGPSVRVICGMPGVGKTALAVKTAHDAAGKLPDAQIYLNFGTHEAGKTPLRPAEALQMLLEMLGIPNARIPVSLNERATLWRAELTHRRAVIILDDVPGEEDLGLFLPAAGDCLILITARHRLEGLNGVYMLPLGVLPGDDARALFAKIAGPERADDPAAVAKAVRLCGYLPLAIRLAASRLSRDDALSVTALVQEMSLPGSGAVPGNAANQEVMSAFEISFLGLPRDQQRLFRRLSIGPCTDINPHTAAALDGTSLADALGGLAVLTDHCLVEQTGEACFRLHDLARNYGMSCALRDEPPPEQRRAASRLLDYYLETADRADRILCPRRRRIDVHAPYPPAAVTVMTGQAEARAWMERERHNILRAAAYASTHEWQQRCAALVHVIAGFLEMRGYWEDAISAHQLALRSCIDLADPQWAVRAALDLSHVYQLTGRYRAAIEHAEHAAVSYRFLGDRQGEAEALHRLGTIHDHMAGYLEALAYYHEAQILYTEADDQRGIADTLHHAAIACWCLGRYPEAAQHLQEALVLYRLAGDREGEATVLLNMGEIQRRQGLHRDAVSRYEEAADILEEIGGKQKRTLIRHNRGIVHQYKGNYQTALTSYLSALAAYREMGDLRDQANVFNDIGVTYQSMGQYGEALAHHQKARALADQIGDRYEQVVALKGIADARRGHGNYDEASSYYDQALKLAREIGDPFQQAKILDAFAETVLRLKGKEAARIYWRQALDILQRLGLPDAESVTIRLEALAAKTR